jgi:hypothetical protein
MFPVGFVVVGLSLSRTALLASGIVAIASRNRFVWLAFLLAVTIQIPLGLLITPERYQISGIWQDVERRESLITGESTDDDFSEITPVNPSEPRVWSVFGYGLGNYTLETGRGIPHNMFVLSFWELGIFSVVFWIGVGWLWWCYSRSLTLLVVFVTVGSLTPEFLSRIEGLFMILGLHTFCTRSANLRHAAERIATAQNGSVRLFARRLIG